MQITTNEIDKLAKDCVIPSKFISEVIKIGSEVMLALIRKRAPYSTGKYSQSWRADVKSNGFEVFTRMRELSILLEFGSNKPYKIEARNAKALRTIGGDFFFSVQHPANKAYPHIRPALTEFKKFFPILVKAKLALYVPIFSNLTNNKYPETKLLQGNNRGGQQRTSTNVSTGLSG